MSRLPKLLEQLQAAKDQHLSESVYQFAPSMPAMNGNSTGFPDGPVSIPSVKLPGYPQVGPNIANWDQKSRCRVKADRLATVATQLAAAIGKTQISPEMDWNQVLLQGAANVLASLEELLTDAGHSEFKDALSDYSQILSKHADDVDAHPSVMDPDGDFGDESAGGGY